MTHVDQLARVAGLLLRRIRAENLETPCLAFIGSLGPSIDSYRPLDVELSSSQFQRLQSLSLISGWSFEGQFKACFPLAGKQGIVWFHQLSEAHSSSL